MKVLKRILFLFVAFGTLALLTNFRSLTGRGLTYRDVAYEKNLVWQGIEVGVVSRQPIGSAIVRGRHRCVIAFPEGKREQARILHATSLGEAPPPLEFVSAEAGKATYRGRDGDVVVDIAQWQQQAPLTERAPGK